MPTKGVANLICRVVTLDQIEPAFSVSHNSSGRGRRKNQHQAAVGLLVSVELVMHILHCRPRPTGQLYTIFLYSQVSAFRKDVLFVLWQEVRSLKTLCFPTIAMADELARLRQALVDAESRASDRLQKAFWDIFTGAIRSEASQ